MTKSSSAKPSLSSPGIEKSTSSPLVRSETKPKASSVSRMKTVKSESWMVSATPIGKYWHITVQGIAGATQARSSREIEPMARDFISITKDLVPGEIAIELERQLPASVSQHLERASRLRATAEIARKEAAEEWRAAALELKASGMTVRHIGDTLGISHQRAQQLIKG